MAIAAATLAVVTFAVVFFLSLAWFDWLLPKGKG